MVAPTKWTGEQDATLWRMWDAGASAAKIAAEIGVTKDAAIARARRIKLDPRPSPLRAGAEDASSAPRVWTAEEDDNLRALSDGTRSYAEIGAILGRSAKAVMGRRSKLAVRVSNESTRPWTPEEDAVLRRMSADKATCELIGQVLKRTAMGVSQRRRKLGIDIGYVRRPTIEIGTRFGTQTVTGPAPQDSRNNAQWMCRCDCGNERPVRGTDLRRGKVLRCGDCARVDQSGRSMQSRSALKKIRVLQAHMDRKPFVVPGPERKPTPPALVDRAPIPGSGPKADPDGPSCRWPMNNRKPWRFCGCVPVHGRAYCPAHEAVSRRGTPMLEAAE